MQREDSQREPAEVLCLLFPHGTASEEEQNSLWRESPICDLT